MKIKTERKHKKEYYTCKRMRMLTYLKAKGFLPYETIPDVKNPRLSCWLFHNTPELEKCIEEYFEKIINKDK